ncbi:MAG: glycosyltransferase family 4 protein, partial [Gammaproteobacteria bacterium]
MTTSFPISAGSSSGIFVARLVESLSKHIDITVLTPASDRPHDVAFSHNLKVFPFAYAPRAWRRLAHQPGGIPEALKERPWYFFLVPSFCLSMFFGCLRQAKGSDLINANWAITGCIAGLAGKLLGKPVVTTLRGSDYNRAKTSWLEHRILGFCLRFNQRIVTVNIAMAKGLQRQFPRWSQKITVIENGVADAFLSLPLVKSKQAGEVPLELLTIGSLTRNKDIATVIRAISQVRDVVKVRLTVIGDGPEKDRLHSMVQEYELAGLVHFVGGVLPERIPSFLANTDVLLVASRSEGRPNVVIEAMAAGRAVVGTRINGVTELIEQGKNGLLFDSGNSRELADCIRKLFMQPELIKEFGDAGRELVKRMNLTWEAAASKYLDLY